ncbi:MAG: hypothetical protein JW924_04990 [Fusobacteriaceae bacterium]|nr:hypothetical protein [Fusobacteriaceae bacterium]
MSYLNEKIIFEEIKIIKNGVELVEEPCGTKMKYDFICRSQGDKWPEK